MNTRGIHVYTVASYNKALLVMPVCFLISLLAVLIMRESHPQKWHR
ncbi:hypothetical protein [Legionella genomosp. 1]|nr:hypothetical protein [Legionella genomosp. 1]